MKHRKIEIPETALVAMELTALNSLQKKKAYREINSIPFILDSGPTYLHVVCGAPQTTCR
ncbi:hypothetical protein RCD60_28715, partial [Klebsiella pneumoniae]|nr:hypothetical protein [Klebsiella pneumoniae]